VSRTHKGFLRRLFELEVPEIHAGTVEIKAIAREAGSRSKVAVSSRQDGLDPVGATVGQRGARVQAVVAELSGEKIDVIPWSDDASVFVANALSPAQVISVDIDEEHRIASVTVPERMLSLAIGREGQNARLAARLTGWRIDIRSDVSVAEAKAAAADAADAADAQMASIEPAAAPQADGSEPAAATAEAAPKPKRTKKAAAAEAAEAGDVATPVEPAEAEAVTAAPKPKRTSKAAAAAAAVAAGATDATNGTNPESATAEAAAEKPKRTRKAAATVASEEVES
jgi:transcription antitermination factor NusA-like protein